MRKMYFSVFLFIVAGLFQSSFSQIMFTASLNGSKEIPAVTTNATATAWAVLSADMTSLTYRITYARLTSAFTASHFHKAPADSSGGVVQAITFSGNTASGTWTNISADNLAALLKGNIYINIHSATNPGGEIRGQLTAVQGIGFTSSLDGAGENPDVVTNAKGTGFAIIKNKGTEVQYALTFAGMSSNVTASHFHNAPADSNGGVVNGFTIGDSTISGTWSNLPDTYITQFLKNRIYMNVHTTNNPSGEIRGQMLHQGEIMFYANLDGAGENPDVATNAKATAYIVMNANLSSLTYNMTYARLSSAFTASHFHNAPADSNGGVVQAISFTGNNSSGTWANMTDSHIQQLIKERLYLNIHTTTNPGGEIRGQVTMVPGIGFTAALDGAQAGAVVTNAKGTGWFSYSPNSLMYQVTIAGLSANLTAAHFHNAPPGTAGGVVQAITFSDSTVNSTWNSIADNLIVELAKGNLYVNVHTSTNPNGEIRGQVRYSNYVSGNVPVELTSFSASVSGKNVELRWATATETNNRGFEIERSSSLTSSGWSKVGFVTGRGSSSEIASYKFTDENVAGTKAYYRLKQINLDGSYEHSNAVEIDLSAPLTFQLNQNYPNPFNPSTTINFSLPGRSNVSLKIYNILGKEVAVLMNEVKEAGNYNINFNASELASGVYLYKLSAGNNVTTKKMMLLK